MSVAAQPPLSSPGPGGTRRSAHTWSRRHPVGSMVVVRLALGVLTIFAVSIVIFLATQALPGSVGDSPGHVAAVRSESADPADRNAGVGDRSVHLPDGARRDDRGARE